MANILDEQERKRKELAAQGIHTRGAAGAKGGPAEMTYKPLEQRTGAEAKALGVSPQMQGQIAQEQGLIPPAALPTPAVTPSQAPAPQARGVAPQAAGVTPQAQAANRQLDLMRQEGMGTTNTSLTQLASQLDPSIKKDAERARQWRLMTPQQRREEVDRLKLEQDMRTADSVVSQDGIAKYARDLADPTGTFIDSYGRSNAIYSPETQIRIREHERKIEAQAADMFSSYDRTKWATEKDMYYAVASLPAVQEAGDLGKAIAFNIVRKYASPEMKAKMEAEDRNLDVFKRTFMSITDQEIDQMQQEMGGEYTNMGNEEFAKQIYINKDDNFRANSLVERVFERAGVRYTVENGRVVPDKGWAAQVKMREEERKAKDAADAKAKERKALEEYEDQRYAAIQQMNPERAAMMIKNPVTGEYDDLSQYGPKPPKPPPPRAATDTAYDAAQTTIQTATRQLELQQTDPIEFKKKAILGAVIPDAQNEEKKAIADIVESISADNDMSAQEISDALAANNFGQVFNPEAFQKAMAEYEIAKSMSPQVLEARKRRAEEEAAQIERDAYGIDAAQTVFPQSYGGPVQIANDAEYDSLPVGTEYIGPDGVRRVK